MSKACKCDRCKKLYDVYDGIPLNGLGNKYNGCVLVGLYATYALDLCPDCMNVLISFIKNGRNEDNGKG